MLDELERAWRELDADPDVRVIVNTGDGHGVPDRPRRRAAQPATRTRCASSRRRTKRRRAAAHRLAQPGVEAGDRRGQRRVRRRRAALRRRRRHRDRRDRRDVPRPARLDRPGRRRTRRSRSCRKSPMEPILRMALDRPPRAHHRRSGPTSSGILSQVVDPPERLRDAAQALAEKIARNSPAAMARDQAGAVGRARARPHRRLPGRGAASSSRMWGHPDQDGGPARVRREARAALAADRPSDGADRREVLDVRLPDRRAARPGRLADQQPARPAQRDERADARRVRRSRGRSSTPTPRCG